ncbi:unnamed protein product [Oppiella nova]|uniref:STAS domain-containing protein n=1 Tax=Oppiella nova TaxID=334625 RepID=A0A7R9LKT0_9ACAR|nr:unnamed protein product [Oppiella nova]CAG2163965.1 unnamed protein product [Oppiella nova]
MDPKYGSNGITNTALDIEDETNTVSSNASPKTQSLNQFNNNRLINLKRDAIDCDEFDTKYQRLPQKHIPFHKELSLEFSKWWQRFSLTTCLMSLFPITRWLPKYNVKTDLLPDFIAGITISILHIPQGIAYSLLAGLEAVNGLYISFFPTLIYTFMGTSRHISIGSFAVASLMLYNTASKLGAVPSRIPLINETTNETIHTDWPPTQLEALTTVCIVTGFIQIAMGSLCLGSLSLILSEHLVSGFSTAVAFHVATSQLNSILGLSLPTQPSGPLKLIYTWIEIAKHIQRANVSTLIFSLIMITILVTFKEWAEPRIKKRISFPIPIDLLVVIFSTLSAWLMDINHRFQVVVIGSVPTGLPDPTIPRLDFVGDVLVDCVIIGIVTFAVSLSLAKISAKNHKYDVDANQELIALGSANLVSSFFLAYPASAALSRSTIQDKIGGKTQIAGIVSCLVILCVLLLLAPFLYHLPKCTLACIILIALKSMFLQIGDFHRIWFVSKLDATAWMVTFLSVIFLDVDLGLIVGIGISILVILVRLVKPTYSLLGCLPSTEIYVDIKKYTKAKEVYGIKIFRFCSPIFYLSTDDFKTRVLDLTKTLHQSINHTIEKSPQITPEALILDMSCVPFMDRSGVDTIVDVFKLLKDKNISVCLASCPIHVIELFERSKFFDSVNKSCFYPTVHDAVVSLR